MTTSIGPDLSSTAAEAISSTNTAPLILGLGVAAAILYCMSSEPDADQSPTLPLSTRDVAPIIEEPSSPVGTISRIFSAIVGGFSWLFSFFCCFGSDEAIASPTPQKGHLQPTPQKSHLQPALVKVWEETEQYLKTPPFQIPKTITKYPAISNKVAVSKLDPHSGSNTTKISIAQEDAIKVAIAKSTNKKVALLNPANAHTIGGGYKKGASAFEEEIFRRSAIAHVLDTPSGKKHYPLEHSSLVYTPKIPFFKNGEKEGYSLMNAPVNVDVITSAAVDKRSSKLSGKALEDETYRRVYNQLKAAKENKAQVLVLCAFGCGVFQNNPHLVARVYSTALKKHFRGVFEEVVFAIPGNKGDIYNAFNAHIQQ